MKKLFQLFGCTTICAVLLSFAGCTHDKDVEAREQMRIEQEAEAKEGAMRIFNAEQNADAVDPTTDPVAVVDDPDAVDPN